MKVHELESPTAHRLMVEDILFSRYRDSAGLPRTYTCYCLRHSIATHLLDAGVALEFVQDHLSRRISPQAGLGELLPGEFDSQVDRREK